MKRVGKSGLGLIVASFGVFSYGVITTGHAAVHYVAPSGNDSNPGKESRPWRTLAKAAEAAVAGDSVLIRSGTYHERLIPQNSGGVGNYITFAAYPGDTPVLDGRNLGIERKGGQVHIQGKAYIRISGLKVMNTGPDRNASGIYVGKSHHIILEKNHTVHTNSSGIKVEMHSSNIIIDGNEVEDATYSGTQECISLAYWVDQFEIRNNYVHDASPDSLTGAEGIDVKSGVSNGKIYNNHVHDVRRVGIYVDAYSIYAHNIEVYNNIVHNMHITGRHDIPGSGVVVAAETGGTVDNVRIYNNICYNNPYHGILVANWDDGGKIRHPMDRITITNNTCYGNGRGISVYNDDAQNVVIRNNILSENRNDQLYITVPLEHPTIEHNLINGPGRFRGDFPIEGDPLFRNADAADFRPLESSPAIDAGSPIDAPSHDFGDNLRPLGAGYDLGAFEYGTPPELHPGLLSFDTGKLSESAFGISVIRIDESVEKVSVPIFRTRGSAGPASVKASIVEGTATPGEDYTASAQILSWADGEMGPKSVNLQILDDDQLETPETLIVRLTNSRGASLTPPNTVLIAIASNEPLPGLAWEAEHGTISAPYVATCGLLAHNLRTNGPSAGGRVSYRFVVHDAGPYVVRALIAASKLAAPPGAVYINVDAEPTGPEMIWDVPGDAFYQERLASWRGSGTRWENEFAPVVFYLTEGEHELILRGSTWGTRIDRIRIVPQGSSLSPPRAPKALRIRPSH